MSKETTIKIGNRADLLGMTERRYATVSFPERNMQFRIRSLSELERSDFETQTLRRDGDIELELVKQSKRHLVALCVVDEVGKTLLNYPDDVEALKPIDGMVTGRLYDACRKHCGFEREDIEDLVKNSARTSA